MNTTFKDLLHDARWAALDASAELQLPLPRAQLTWYNTPAGNTSECIYSLVLPLRENDCRGDHEDGRQRQEHHLIDNITANDGPVDPTEITLRGPYRDTTHARRDAAALNIPCFLISGNRHELCLPCLD